MFRIIFAAYFLFAPVLIPETTTTGECVPLGHGLKLYILTIETQKGVAAQYLGKGSTCASARQDALDRFKRERSR